MDRKEKHCNDLISINLNRNVNIVSTLKEKKKDDNNNNNNI